MKTLFLLFGLFGYLWLASGETRPYGHCSSSPELAKETVKPLVDFSIQLYKKLVAANPQKNVVYSPVSIALALALLEQGTGGQSKTELDRLLFGGPKPNSAAFYESLQSLLKSNHSDVVLNIANGLFIGKDFSFKEQFPERAKCYKAEVKKIDFRDTAGAARQINDWAANATNQRIKNLLTADAVRNAKLILTNAIYLKAPWEDKLEVMPNEVDFYRFGRDNDKQKVTFIRNVDSYLYASDGAFDIVKMPYLGGSLAFFVILPKQRNGLQAVESQLTTEKLRSLKDRLNFKRLDLQLPRFSVRTPFPLTDHLKALGLNHIFSNQADLSALSPQTLKVDSATHQAFIKVNENGTEAAAVTVIKITPVSIPPPPVPFIVDHPFHFAIVHEATKAPLFMSRVNFVEQVD